MDATVSQDHARHAEKHQAIPELARLADHARRPRTGVLDNPATASRPDLVDDLHPQTPTPPQQRHPNGEEAGGTRSDDRNHC